MGIVIQRRTELVGISKDQLLELLNALEPFGWVAFRIEAFYGERTRGERRQTLRSGTTWSYSTDYVDSRPSWIEVDLMRAVIEENIARLTQMERGGLRTALASLSSALPELPPVPPRPPPASAFFAWGAAGGAPVFLVAGQLVGSKAGPLIGLGFAVASLVLCGILFFRRDREHKRVIAAFEEEHAEALMAHRVQRVAVERQLTDLLTDLVGPPVDLGAKMSQAIQFVQARDVFATYFARPHDLSEAVGRAARTPSRAPASAPATPSADPSPCPFAGRVLATAKGGAGGFSWDTLEEVLRIERDWSVRGPAMPDGGWVDVDGWLRTGAFHRDPTLTGAAAPGRLVGRIDGSSAIVQGVAGRWERV